MPVTVLLPCNKVVTTWYVHLQPGHWPNHIACDEVVIMLQGCNNLVHSIVHTYNLVTGHNDMACDELKVS